MGLYHPGSESAVAPEKSWLWPPTVPVLGGQDSHLPVWLHSIHVHLCLCACGVFMEETKRIPWLEWFSG